MGNNVHICPTCGHKIVDYKHSMTKVLVSCLRKLYNAGGKSKKGPMNLTTTQFGNFQKLRYFGLAELNPKTQEWMLMPSGLAFLRGKIRVPRYIITRSGKVIGISPESIDITQVKDAVQYRVEWQEQARPNGLFD